MASDGSASDRRFRSTRAYLHVGCELRYDLIAVLGCAQRKRRKDHQNTKNTTRNTLAGQVDIKSHSWNLGQVDINSHCWNLLP
jgi:hypothetical protein